MHEQLSSLDENFWHIDSKNNRQNVSLIYILEQQADPIKVEQLILEHLDHFPLKKKKISTVSSKLSWQQESNFLPKEHFFSIEDNKGNSIEKITGDILSKDIDKNISPWRVITISSPQAKTDKFAIMFFWHHALCDGVGYLEYVESMSSKTKDGPIRLDKMLSRKKKYSQRAKNTRSVVYHLYESGIKLFNDFFCSSIKSPFNGENGSSRSLAFLDLPLKEVNESRKNLSASLYEYMLTLTTIAAKNYILEKKHLLKNLRVIIPVNMREKDESLNLSNYISGSSLMLPLLENKTSEIVKDIQFQLKSIKISFAYKILAACNAKLPPKLQRALAEFAAKKTNFICSTAPGAAQDRFLTGIKINKIYGTPALMKGQGLSLGFIRCSELMTTTLTYDPSILEDPQALIQKIEQAHNSLLKVDS